MTLSSKLCKVIHQIDPTVTVYSFPFKIFKKHEAAVWLLGPDDRESARLRLDGDYLISGLESDSGGEISLTESGLALAAAAQSLLIIRELDFTQDIDYRPHDIFPAHSHEAALDLLTMQNQQLLEMIQRAPLLPIGRQGGDPWGEFAALTGRANDAAQTAESAARGAADAGREAAASAKAALEAALKAEKSLSELVSHNGDPSAHGILTGDRLPYRLTRDTVFYVRPDGNDNNDGSADTAASALKTIAGALDRLRRTDQRGYRATVSLVPGNWPGTVVYGYQIPGLVKFTSTLPDNPAFIAGLRADSLASVEVAAIGFNGGYYMLNAGYLSRLYVTGPIIFKGSAPVMFSASNGSFLRFDAASTQVRFEAAAASSSVVLASDNGSVYMPNIVFTGTVTGRRFNVGALSSIITGNRGPDYIPGTSAGTVAGGGFYQ